MKLPYSILPAKPKDFKELTSITKHSKAYWGYTGTQLKMWEDELTVSAPYIEKNIVKKVINKEQILGYYALHPPKNTSIYLEMLFILPKYIGKGIGKLLLEDAFMKAKALGCKEMSLKADPNATNFYLKFGFKIIDKEESSIPGRYLPIMVKTFENL